MDLFQGFFESLVDSHELVPWQIKELTHHILQETIRKFGLASNSVRTCVGGYFFLRFFCPALTMPHTLGVIDAAPSGKTFKTLVLMAKVLQNMANYVRFGDKERHMVALNILLERNSDRFAHFLKELYRVLICLCVVIVD